ncbi:MAG: DUF192 domain-containing protein [Acidimicrobiia bacterium]
MRAGRVVALVLAALVVAGVAVLAVRAISDDDPSGAKPSGTLAASLAAAQPAVDPFTGLTETQIAVGDTCLRTVIADSLQERVEGLRQRSDIGPYDAMLFAFGNTVDVGFTMSTVPVPLEIGFYSADGTRTSSQHMLPCPKAENECPVYRASEPFAFALETLNRKLPKGDLGGCTPS